MPNGLWWHWYPAHYNGSPLLRHIVEHFLSIPNVCRSEGGGGFGEWQKYSHGFETLQGIAMDVQWHSFCHITFIYVCNESHKRCLNHSITHIVVLQRLSLSVQIIYLLRILGLLLNDGQWISSCFNIQWSSRCQYHCWQSHQNRGLNCFIYNFQIGILSAIFNFLVYVFECLLTD